MDSSIISQLPFPAFISKKGIIFCTNDSFRSIIKDSEGEPIELVFDNLEEHETYTLARFNDKRILFLTEQEDPYVYYIGTENSHFSDLEKQVAELENLNRELDSIIDNSYDGIYITDNEGITLKTNTAIERLTGIPKEYYIGKNVDRLVNRGILRDSVTKKVLKQRKTVSVVQDNFEGKETLITGSPIYNKKGDIEKVITNIRDISELNKLISELNSVQKKNAEYAKELEQLKGYSNSGIIIESEAMKELYETASRIANFDATVLILGETGVGKDVLARFIYSKSKRASNGDFIKINCGAIPQELIESELFGYEGGAFTGANRNGKPGMFELADDGVLFLDEVGELPLKTQVKLLQVIQDNTIQRVGATKHKKVNVRIIAATNRNLLQMVTNHEFREDLFYRLNVIPFSIPPLRERRDDILPLIQFFLNRTNIKYNLDKYLKSDLKNSLYELNWKGNVREMANLIERIVLTTSERAISHDHLPAEYKKKSSTPQVQSLKEAVENTERSVLEDAYLKYNSTYEISRILNTSQPTIVRKLKKYQIGT
ncbi:sigma-54 interaction domain-containing protein [Bacillus sp. RAR_GA_16]|uniref:sigma-54 interaction domain-containing protein n=1 Tax=Bacillus sp. RAR_GA_16 TaxID=2876774 RepID=UPI001CCF1246|nr:sigma 54-interacting transcriptional regulator [Bacillus sp. RAR_GA_16]MCA0171862.1 sigma 54-interacting transcriptional regulator [Bacillus sp. RAR_GA_16]